MGLASNDRVGVRLWLHVLFVVAVGLPSVGGCEMKLGGKTAKEVFADPTVAELARAAAEGDTATLERLAKNGADVNGRGLNGATPLIWAQTLGSRVGVRRLLELGADPNLKANYGQSAITRAAAGDDPEILELLLKGGGDPNIRDTVDSALQHAVRHVQRDFQLRKRMVETLLRYGADINQADEVRRTVATSACALNQYDMVVFLLECGYSYDLVDLARCVEIGIVAKDHEQYQWKLRTLDMLKARGVQFPLPPPPRRKMGAS